MDRCLSQDELSALIAGGLSFAERSRLGGHLDVCPSCTQSLQYLSTADGATARPGSPASSPKNIPGYSILGEIHRGSQGVVYEAIQRATRRKVALKILLHEQTASAEERRRFLQEIDIVASLRHPNIVTIHDSGADEGLYYSAMELIRGQRLDEYVKNGDLGIQEVLVLFRKICLAVAHAHAHGIVHRDLKPGNILVDGEGEPHVLDFGLAKLKPVGATLATDSTRTGVFLGTLAYSSPEQTMGDPRLVTERSDVYSLGVILYALLTGQEPYRLPPDIEGALRAIREAEPVRPSKVRRGIDRDVETITRGCLSKEPHRRYASARELAEDVTRYLEQEPILARGDSIVYRIRKGIRRTAARHTWTARVAILILAVSPATYAFKILPELFEPVDRHLESPGRRLLKSLYHGQWNDSVLVVVLDDETFDSIPDLARQANLTGVDPRDLTSVRRLHGELMKRLARAKPSVVAWDIVFRSIQDEHDPYLVQGIKELAAAGTKVILAVPQVDQAGEPQLSPRVAHAAHGWGWLYLAKSEETQLVHGAMLSIRHVPYGTTPSLAVAAYAAYRHPEYRAVINWQGERNYLEIEYYSRNPAFSFPMTCDRIFFSEREHECQFGAPPGTDLSERMSADHLTVVPSEDVLARHTISYGRLFQADAQSLDGLIRGKILLIGDTRSERTSTPDWRRLDDGAGGRLEAGCYMHATTLCDLLNQYHLPHPGALLDWMLLLLFAILSQILAAWLEDRQAMLRWSAQMTTLIGITLFTFFGAALAFRILLSPSLLLLTATLSLMMSRWVRRIGSPYSTPGGKGSTHGLAPSAC